MAARPDPATICLVIPAHNEADCLPALHARLLPVLAGGGDSWRLVLVDDGSTDRTLATMHALRAGDPRIGIVTLSRRFGKEIAVTAGLDHALGDAVILLDADGQDPPELIPALLAAWRAGADMAVAQRTGRDGDSRLKRLTAAGFYALMSRLGEAPLPANVGDYRLMDRRVVNAVLSLRERHRFNKGLFAWVGFRTVAVPYARAARHAGASKWPYRRLWRLAVEGITGFTVLPLRLASYLGLLVAALTVPFALQLVVRALVFGNPVAGYPSLMVVILFLGSVQLLTLGVIGEYLGRMFNEVKRRPLYLIDEVLPPADDPAPSSRSSSPDRSSAARSSLPPT